MVGKKLKAAFACKKQKSDRKFRKTAKKVDSPNLPPSSCPGSEEYSFNRNLLNVSCRSSDSVVNYREDHAKHSSNYKSHRTNRLTAGGSKTNLGKGAGGYSADKAGKVKFEDEAHCSYYRDTFGPTADETLLLGLETIRCYFSGEAAAEEPQTSDLDLYSPTQNTTRVACSGAKSRRSSSESTFSSSCSLTYDCEYDPCFSRSTPSDKGQCSRSTQDDREEHSRTTSTPSKRKTQSRSTPTEREVHSKSTSTRTDKEILLKATPADRELILGSTPCPIKKESITCESESHGKGHARFSCKPPNKIPEYYSSTDNAYSTRTNISKNTHATHPAKGHSAQPPPEVPEVCRSFCSTSSTRTVKPKRVSIPPPPQTSPKYIDSPCAPYAIIRCPSNKSFGCQCQIEMVNKETCTNNSYNFSDSDTMRDIENSCGGATSKVKPAGPYCEPTCKLRIPEPVAKDIQRPCGCKAKATSGGAQHEQTFKTKVSELVGPACGDNLVDLRSMAVPKETRYAIAVIKKYDDFTLFEIMESTAKSPKKIPSKAENVFTIRNNRQPKY